MSASKSVTGVGIPYLLSVLFQNLAKNKEAMTDQRKYLPQEDKRPNRIDTGRIQT
jgi:hypothetical protein